MWNIETYFSGGRSLKDQSGDDTVTKTEKILQGFVRSKERVSVVTGKSTIDVPEQFYRTRYSTKRHRARVFIKPEPQKMRGVANASH